MREAAGLSQREVGRRAKINSGRISVIERGIQPTPEEESALREVLGRALLDPERAA
jgi:transcriptional regulator with XRE-family HTH domain